MKIFRVRTGMIFASWALFLIFGCHKKKPHIPPAETPPTIISQIPIEQEPETGKGADEQNPTPQEQQANTTPPAKPAPPKRQKHVPTKKADEPEKPATTELAKNTPPTPPRIVIQEGNAPNSASGQMAAGTGKDAASNGQSTQQLIDSTENNLRSIKRQLSQDEESMVTQARDYINGSKQATKDGDFVRAHNLANKAHLLSEELIKAK